MRHKLFNKKKFLSPTSKDINLFHSCSTSDTVYIKQCMKYNLFTSLMKTLNNNLELRKICDNYIRGCYSSRSANPTYALPSQMELRKFQGEKQTQSAKAKFKQLEFREMLKSDGYKLTIILMKVTLLQVYTHLTSKSKNEMVSYFYLYFTYINTEIYSFFEELLATSA